MENSTMNMKICLHYWCIAKKLCMRRQKIFNIFIPPSASDFCMKRISRMRIFTRVWVENGKFQLNFFLSGNASKNGTYKEGRSHAADWLHIHFHCTQTTSINLSLSKLRLLYLCCLLLCVVCLDFPTSVLFDAWCWKHNKHRHKHAMHFFI